MTQTETPAPPLSAAEPSLFKRPRRAGRRQREDVAATPSHETPSSPRPRRVRVSDSASAAKARRWPAANEIRAKVLGRVVEAGAAGVTAPEIAAALAGDVARHPTNRRRNLVAGRLVELATIGLVTDTGRRRDGWNVWAVTVAGGTEGNLGTGRRPAEDATP